MNKVKVNTGMKSYEIEDLDGNIIGTFRFVPSDPGILNRYKECVEFFDGLSAMTNGKNPEEYLPGLEKQAGEKIDLLFGSPVSGDFFKVTSPFTVLESGKMYCEEIIEVIGGVLEKEFEARSKAAQKRMSKYTAKYQKEKKTPEDKAD